MTQSLPTGRARILLVAAILVHLVYVAALPLGFLRSLAPEAHLGFGQASDFFGIYQAGANLIGGYSIYDFHDYRNEAPPVVPYSYFYRYLPPTAYAAGMAAALLAPWPAYWLWIVLNELLIGVIVFLLLRWKRWPADRCYFAVAPWLVFFPVYVEQFMGQFSIIMAALLLLLWRADLRSAERPSRGGAPDPTAEPTPQSGSSFPGFWAPLRAWRHYTWRRDCVGSRWVVLSWAASVTLKSFSAMLAFPYLRDRRLKRVLAGALVGIAVCLPYFLFRPADLLEFVRLNFNPFTPVVYKGAYGLQAFLGDLYSHLPQEWLAAGFRIAGRTLTIHRGLMLLPSALIFLGAIWGTLRLRPLPVAQRRAFDLLIWTAVFLLVFKNIWEYHYLMLLPGLTGVYLTTRARAPLILGILLALPTLYPLAVALPGIDVTADLKTWPIWFRIPHFGFKSLPTLVLLIWVLCRVRQKTRGAVLDGSAA